MREYVNRTYLGIPYLLVREVVKIEKSYIREQECDEEPVPGEGRDLVWVPRSIALSVDIPSVPTRWDGPPLITELSSALERRTLFDDDETYESRAERSQIVDSPFREETRDINSEEPRISVAGIPVRPTLPRETSISSSKPPSVPVTGMLGYGGGPMSPHRPGMVRTSMGTASQRVTSGGGGGGDDSSSNHSHWSEGRPPGRGRGPPRGGGGGDPPYNGNGNGNGDGDGDGDGNGDGEEGDESSISSH